MISPNSFNGKYLHSKLSTSPPALSDYQMAVLSTLFEQEDAEKLIDLARQWGYQPEVLHSVWAKFHQKQFR